MSNSISFCGRLGRDSVLKAVGDSSVLNFAVANDVGYGDKKNTNWMNCAVWGKQAEKLEQYLTKGKQVFISGELNLRKYTNKDGVEALSPDVRVTFVDFVGSKSDSSDAGPSEPRRSEPSAAAPAKAAPASMDAEDDGDLPF